MPLFRVFRRNTRFRIGKELICLAHRHSVVAEKTGLCYESLGCILRSECLQVVVDVKSHLTVQEPIPSYRTCCLQLIVHQHDIVWIEHQYMSSVFLECCGAEAELWSLWNTCSLESVYPHVVVGYSAVGMRSISQAVGDMIAAHGSRNVAITCGREWLADAIY